MRRTRRSFVRHPLRGRPGHAASDRPRGSLDARRRRHGCVVQGPDRELDDLVGAQDAEARGGGEGPVERTEEASSSWRRKIIQQNFLRNFDSGEIDGNPFISMDTRARPDAARHAGALGPAALSAGLRLAVQLHAGLAAAHAQAIIDGDIKPENIIRRLAGQRRADGLRPARPVTRPHPRADPGRLHRRTPHDLARKAARGKEPDARHVYACGVGAVRKSSWPAPFGGDRTSWRSSPSTCARRGRAARVLAGDPPALERLAAGAGRTPAAATPTPPALVVEPTS